MSPVPRPRDAGPTEQPELPGVPEPLVTTTPSRLAAFEDCPRRYRYAYLDRPRPPKGPPWAHNSVGASVHTVLKQWYDVPAPRRRPELVAALLRGAWVRDGYRDVEQERHVYRRVLGWLKSYVDHLPPEPVGVERTVAARTRVMAFHGRADRIDARPELVVVDYKTGREEPTQDTAAGSAALALYAFAVERTFRRPCRRVELHHLPTGTVAAAELSEERIARHVARAEATAADIREATSAVARGADPDEAFPALGGPQCGWCDFRAVCPEGATRPARQPWAAVARWAEEG